MKNKNWRFIPYKCFEASLNMAIDELLLEQAIHGCAPTLRLYGFEPAAVSIGLNQKIDNLSLERIKSKQFSLTRRPSGGRAVLHFKDLTYSFIACEKSHCEFGFLEHSVSLAYKQICRGLEEAFSSLGVKSKMGASETKYRHLSDCFLATTSADLHYNGKKLVGSAQLRRSSAVLQHGSIPLNLEQELMSELLGSDITIERHANLFEIIGYNLSYEDLNEIIMRGFSKAFDCTFDIYQLSANEIEKAKLLKSKFEIEENSLECKAKTT